MFCTIIYFVLTIRERFDMYNKRWSNLKRRFILSEVATNVNSQQTKVKFGFTLAEVLITLGIIGVVAAMTIPNLIATHQKKQTVVKLQKAISVMNQAYRLAYDDVGEVTVNSVYVDINGTAKPNTMGKDIFMLERKIDGEKGGVVVPAYSSLTNAQVDRNCSKSGTGECCAEKIKRAGWRIDKSYPWK